MSTTPAATGCEHPSWTSTLALKFAVCDECGAVRRDRFSPWLTRPADPAKPKP